MKKLLRQKKRQKNECAIEHCEGKPRKSNKGIKIFQRFCGVCLKEAKELFIAEFTEFEEVPA